MDTTTTPAYKMPAVAARRATQLLERAGMLDAVAKPLAAGVRRLTGTGAVKDAISGTGLGHPAHPPLTDLVIGSLLSASLLDLVAPRAGNRAASCLIGLGAVAFAPTALTGLSDWADTELSDARVRRAGLGHAGMNLAALAMYCGSLVARRSGGRIRGALWALGGAATLAGAGYLGGHLAYVRGVGGNQTAFDPGPQDWTPALADTDLTDGTLYAADAGGTPVLIVRRDGRSYALHDRCSHRGCPLSTGQLDGYRITCACHGSQFDIRDGSLLRGPAVVGQPALDCRAVGGQIEVRRPV